MARITTVEALRQLIPPPRETTRAKVRDRIDSQGRDFIAASPFAILATSNADGMIEVSPKGDVPGFVTIVDDRTLLLPDRVGNNLAFGLLNIIDNPNVALIFLVPNTGETLRITGKAEIRDDEDLREQMSARGSTPKVVIRIQVERAYFHCARSVLRANLWQPETWREPHRVSFGKIFKEIMPETAPDAAVIDQGIEAAYKVL